VIFSFFRTAKNRQFTYRPLYYRPEAEEQALRHGSNNLRRTRGAEEGDLGEYADLTAGSSEVSFAGVIGDALNSAREDGQRQHRAALRFRRQVLRQEAQQSNRRLLFIVFIMLSMLLLLFGELKKLMYLLPIFIPLLWWTFRRAAWEREKTGAGLQGHHHTRNLGQPASTRRDAEPTQPT